MLWEEEDTEGLCEGRRRICVDNMLCKHLREHQREGVQFMFGCVMGFRDFQGNGCILADDMGLGKTLQAVTLLWTLLTQGTTEQSVCRRGLVVCPTSLVRPAPPSSPPTPSFLFVSIIIFICFDLIPECMSLTGRTSSPSTRHFVPFKECFMTMLQVVARPHECVGLQ